MARLPARVIGIDSENTSVFLHVQRSSYIVRVEGEKYTWVEEGAFVEFDVEGCITPTTWNADDDGSGMQMEKRMKRFHEEDHLVTPGSRGSAQSSQETNVFPYMRVTSIEEVFRSMKQGENMSEAVRMGDTAEEIFRSMGLNFTEATSFERIQFGEFSEIPEDEALEDSYDARALVDHDTGNAKSISESGPTSQAVKQFLQKLIFPCQGHLCECYGERCYPLNQLMPTLVGDKVKDLCWTAFRRYMNTTMTKKAFRLTVAQKRTSEKLAVTLSDVMKHAPMETACDNF